MFNVHWIFCLCACVVPGMGNTSPKDMDTLLPLMNMVIYSIDKVKKLRLNREVSRTLVLWCRIQMTTHLLLFCTLKLDFKVQLRVPFILPVYLGQTESWQKPGPCGGELPETDSRSASGGSPDPPRGEEESWEGEDHEWGGPWETTSSGGLKSDMPHTNPTKRQKEE